MRNEQEVLNQLSDYAKSNENVRIVILNGSRVNDNAPKDIFCDYDILFGVRDPKLFLNDQSWIRNFGELIIMQQNDIDIKGVEAHIFLMLFADGVRIDLSFHPIEAIDVALEDSLKLVLLDKDNRIRVIEPPNDISYYTKKPSQKEFDEAMNEFWWCSTNVAKGLWREELSYSKYMFEVILRECIIKALAWYIGMKYDWCINTGKAGKWFQRYLPEELWESFEKSYIGRGCDDIWEALFEAGRLMRKVGLELAEGLEYKYPIDDDKRVNEYLKRVCSLPKNADSFD